MGADFWQENTRKYGFTWALLCNLYVSHKQNGQCLCGDQGHRNKIQIIHKLMLLGLVWDHVLPSPGKIMLASLHSNNDEVFKSFVKHKASAKQTKPTNQNKKQTRGNSTVNLFFQSMSQQNSSSPERLCATHSLLPAARTHGLQISCVQWSYAAVT